MNKVWLVPAIGAALLLVGLWVLGANERSAAAWHRGMARHGGNVLVLGKNASPDADQDGRQVLVTGTPEVVEPPRDRDFRMRADTSLLVRKVAMFQWHEVRVGGQVSYHQDWVDHAVDSSRFEHPERHANTQPFPFTGQTFQAPQMRLNHYTLAPAIVRALPGALQPVAPETDRLPANLQASFRTYGHVLTTSADPQHPRLGDLRVQWLARPLQTVTVVARVDGGQLVPATGAGKGFSVQIGERSLTDIFPDLPLSPGAVRVWRVLALLLAVSGIWLVVRPRCPERLAVPMALAAGVTVLGILAGVMWVTASVMVAVIAWLIAVLAVLAGWQGWRRLT